MNLLLQHILVLPNYKLNDTLVYGIRDTNKSILITKNKSLSSSNITKSINSKNFNSPE